MSSESERQKFFKLYNEYHPMVRSVLFNMTGREHLEDLTQETFLKVWKGLSRFAFRSSVKTWVYKVCLNTAIDHLKKRSLRMVELSEEIEAEPVNGDQESQKVIHAALQDLDEIHRGVIVLYYFEGLQLEEISQVMEIPIGTVKSRLHGARSKLKEVLVQKGFLDEIA